LQTAKGDHTGNSEKTLWYLMDHPEARDHATRGISVILPSVTPLDRNQQFEINTHGAN